MARKVQLCDDEEEEEEFVVELFQMNEKMQK